jgi:nitroimidazol reductase NimA-like FMN-containing flavoprotein (pyridoxamine 5'-phosphate oxidase superfamily)
MEYDSAGLEVLPRSQCVRLLDSTDRGRLGLNVGALPTILPVRYAIDGDEVLVSVQVGSVADKATNSNVVAFQADGTEANGAEWSVTVIGVGRHLTTPDDMRRSEALLVPLWSKGASRRFVAISTDHVTGRRTVEECVGDVPGPR